MRRHLAAIMTGCPVSLFGADANATTRGANRGIEHRHRKDSDNEASLVGFLSHSYYYRTILPDLFLLAATSVKRTNFKTAVALDFLQLCNTEQQRRR